MQITVVTVAGNMKTLEVNEQEKISTLKDKAKDVTGICVSDHQVIKLVFECTILLNDHTLEESGIQDGAKLDLVVVQLCHVCPKCSKGYETDRALNTHMILVHSKAPLMPTSRKRKLHSDSQIASRINSLNLEFA